MKVSGVLGISPLPISVSVSLWPCAFDGTINPFTALACKISGLTFIGRFPSDDAASMAVKGLKSKTLSLSLSRALLFISQDKRFKGRLDVQPSLDFGKSFFFSFSLLFLPFFFFSVSPSLSPIKHRETSPKAIGLKGNRVVSPECRES